MPELVVGLDLHLKRAQGTVMAMNGRIVRQEKFGTTRENLAKFLQDLPRSTEVALEAQGFCWPWIDYIEKLGYTSPLANPIKLKSVAEDVKTDRIDSG